MSVSFTWGVSIGKSRIEICFIHVYISRKLFMNKYTLDYNNYFVYIIKHHIFNYNVFFLINHWYIAIYGCPVLNKHLNIIRMLYCYFYGKITFGTFHGKSRKYIKYTKISKVFNYKKCTNQYSNTGQYLVKHRNSG